MNKASPATNKAGTKDTSHLRDIFTITFNYLLLHAMHYACKSYSSNNVFSFTIVIMKGPACIISKLSNLSAITIIGRSSAISVCSCKLVFRIKQTNFFPDF